MLFSILSITLGNETNYYKYLFYIFIDCLFVSNWITSQIDNKDDFIFKATR